MGKLFFNLVQLSHCFSNAPQSVFVVQRICERFLYHQVSRRISLMFAWVEALADNHYDVLIGLGVASCKIK